MDSATATMRIPISAASYAAAIEGLTRIDERILSSGVGAKIPPIYQSGVRYKREPQDVWRHVGDVLKSGWGDCEDLSAWRAAELRVSGEDPKAHVAVYQSGPRRYHAIVARGDGSTEDPSRRLGMKPRGKSPMGTLEGRSMKKSADSEARRERRKRAKAIARRCVQTMRREPIPQAAGAWIGLGDDPSPTDGGNLTFDLYRSGQGWSGIVRVPLALTMRGAPQALVAKTTPTLPADASPAASQAAKQVTATKAINLAAKIAKMPAVQALLPPQAKMAMQVLKSPIGKLATKGAGKLLKKLF